MKSQCHLNQVKHQRKNTFVTGMVMGTLALGNVWDVCRVLVMVLPNVLYCAH